MDEYDHSVSHFSFLGFSHNFQNQKIDHLFIKIFRSEEYPKEHYDGQRVTSMATKTSVDVTALDGLVSVNSLFTIAVFMGLSLTVTEEQCIENCACDAGTDVVKNLLVFEFVSFSLFLFSSLTAQGLKLTLNLLNSKDVRGAMADINIMVLRVGILASALGSVMGCLFLMLSMMNVIQIRLGMLSCSKSAVYSVVVLFVFVPTALVGYIGTAIYAIFWASPDPENSNALQQPLLEDSD